MSLTVVSIAYPLVPIGPDTVGGTEQVLAMLDEALERHGHRSIVIAPEGSKVKGMLIPTPSRQGSGPIDEATWDRAYDLHRRALEAVLETVAVDVVHMHGVDFHSYLPNPGLPVLATLHLPPHNYPADVSRPDRPLTFLNCVSHYSRRQYPDDAPMTVITNGTRLDRFRPVATKDDFVLALGRICPEKGFHVALDAARKADVRLLIGGIVSPFAEHYRYFEQEILPRLDERRQFLGALPLAQRAELLARARCVVVPSLVHETSSLVAIEALASGTAVVARPVGALPENIEHGRTGLFAHDVDEMARAFTSVEAIDTRECRQVACERFSGERAAQSYIEVYQELAAAGHAGVRWQAPAWARHATCIQ
jgi:glycosyltransferase involved in cell wall biosynthesis